MEVICYLFGAHCICDANSIVRDDEWSCSGECFEIVCFYFYPCLICLCRCWIYIYLLLSVMAKLRGVSSTSGNSIKRRSSNLAKPKLYLVRTSNGYADLARPILECFIHGVGSTRLYAKGILIVSRRVCHD